MSKDLDLRLRLTATDKNVAGTVRNTKKEVQGLNETLGTTNSRTRGTASGFSGVTTAGQEATRMFKLQKGSLQQAGFQFQDLAVQIGSGTSAFVAIGQQGSQLLGILGPGGAVLGAVLAFGSVIGGFFANSMMEGADAADALDKAMERLDKTIEENDGIPTLTKEIRDLARESEIAARARIVSAMQAAEQATKSAANSIRDSFDDIADTVGFSSLSDFFEGNPTIGAVTAGAIADLRDSLELTGDAGTEAARKIFIALRRVDADPAIENIRELERVIAEVSTGVGSDSDALQPLVGSLGEFFDAARTAEERAQFLKSIIDDLGAASGGEAADKVAELVEKLEMQAETQGKTTLEMIRYNQAADIKTATENEATDAQLASIRAAYDQIYAYEQNAIATKKADEAQREYERSLDSLLNKLQPVRNEFDQFRRDQELLDQALAKGIEDGGISPERYQALTEALVQSFANAGEESAEQFVNPFEDAAGRVSQAVQNAIASGEWDTIGDAIGNTLASSISSIIDTSITRTLSRDLTASSGIGQQLAAAFAGPMLGAVAGGAVQLAINELDDYFSDDWDPTADRQAAQGTGTVLGDINAKSESIRRAVEGSESGIDQLVGINQGMLQALKNLQSAISGASDRIARGRSGVSIGMPGVMSGSDVFDDLTGGVLPLFDETLGLAFDFFDEATNILTLGLVDLGSLLGGKSKKRDEGIRIVGGYISDLIDETLVQAYATFRVKKNFLDDYDTKEKFAQLDDDVGRQFALVFESLYSTIEAGADALGILPETIRDRLKDFEVATQRISLEGLDAAEQQAEIEAYFSKVFDDLTSSAVPFVREFQRAGEGLGETLARVASQVGLLEEVIGTLTLDSGMSYYLTPEGSARIADSLANLSGGTEALASNLSGYENNFLSEADQFDLLTRRLGEAMNGLPLPETREGFVALLQAQNLITTEGQENAATLLRLQDIANDYYDTVEDRAEQQARQEEERAQKLAQQERDALANLVSATDSALSALVSSVSDRTQTLTDAFNQEQQQIRDMTEARLAGNQLALDAATEGLRTLRQEVQGITKAADSLRDIYEPIQEQRREQALDTLRRALATGDLGGTGDAADLVSQISAGNYTNSVDYERAQGQSLNLLSALEQEGGKQLTAAEEAVLRLEQQTKIIRDQGDSALDAAREEHEAEIQQLEHLVTDAEDQLNTLRGIETGVLSIADALAGLATAIGAEFPQREIGDESLPAGDLVDNLYKAQGWDKYQQDDSGRQYWIDRIKDGLTGEALAAEFAAAGNAYLADQVPGFANGGTHTGGLRVVGERGPELEFTGPSRIFSNAQSRDLLDLSPVVNALGQLEKRLVRVEAYQRQTTKNTGDIARSHTRWERAGIKTREVTP